jgi:hypothetical protein
MAKTAKSDVSARKKSGIIRPFCTAGHISQGFTIFKPEHVADKQPAKVTIEIDARLPNGTTDQLVRAVMENSRTLKFDSPGFETE